MQRTIELPDEQAQELERLAARDHRDLDELVQFALSDYLGRRKSQPDWAKRLGEAIATIRERVPAEAKPEEIESDVTAAWEEYRAERAAQIV